MYAYGVLLYEVFTRKPVWEGLRHPQIIHAIAVQKKHPELPETAPVAYKVFLPCCYIQSGNLDFGMKQHYGFTLKHLQLLGFKKTK